LKPAERTLARKSAPWEASRTAAGAHLAGQDFEAPERGHCAVLGGFGQLATLGQPLAEPRHHLFVENDRWDAGRAGIDDQAHRVRADIDDGDGFFGHEGVRA
jgi:hypothetical protein